MNFILVWLIFVGNARGNFFFGKHRSNHFKHSAYTDFDYAFYKEAEVVEGQHHLRHHHEDNPWPVKKEAVVEVGKVGHFH